MSRDLLSLLQRLEWAGLLLGSWPICPLCDRLKPGEDAPDCYGPVGHAPDCDLAAAIREAAHETSRLRALRCPCGETMPMISPAGALACPKCGRTAHSHEVVAHNLKTPHVKVTEVVGFFDHDWENQWAGEYELAELVPDEALPQCESDEDGKPHGSEYARGHGPRGHFRIVVEFTPEEKP